MTSYVHSNDVIARLNKKDLHRVPMLELLLGVKGDLTSVLSEYNHYVHGKGSVILLKNEVNILAKVINSSSLCYKAFILESDPKDESMFSREALLDIHDSITGRIMYFTTLVLDQGLDSCKAAILNIQSRL